MELLQLTEDNAVEVISQFGKKIVDGKIIDPDTGDQVECRYTKVPLTIENFGGILPGSDVFISDTDTALAGYTLEFLSGNDGSK